VNAHRGGTLSVGLAQVKWPTAEHIRITGKIITPLSSFFPSMCMSHQHIAFQSRESKFEQGQVMLQLDFKGAK
jgi:hypothetical protein